MSLVAYSKHAQVESDADRHRHGTVPDTNQDRVMEMTEVSLRLLL